MKRRARAVSARLRRIAGPAAGAWTAQRPRTSPHCGENACHEGESSADRHDFNLESGDHILTSTIQ
jgi:hypothetical protein